MLDMSQIKCKNCIVSSTQLFLVVLNYLTIPTPSNQLKDYSEETLLAVWNFVMQSIQPYRKAHQGQRFDDFNLKGEISDTAKDVQRIIDAQATTSLFLNRHKC